MRARRNRYIPLRRSSGRDVNTGKSTKKVIFLLFKVAVSSALLAYLLSKVGGMAVLENAILLSPLHFGAAAALYLFAAYLSSLRWKLLIPQPVRTGRLFSMYIIGSFFNVCLPGIIGGDAIKAFYLSRELQLKPPAANAGDAGKGTVSVAVASVFMDRYIGLAALLFIGLAACPAGIDVLTKASALWVLPVIFVSFVAASLILFKARLGGRVKFLMGVYSAFDYYFAKRHVLFNSFMYSIAIQLSGMASVYILARGLSLEIGIVSILVFLPMIILISMVPVSISGLGIREGAFVFFLGTMGISADRAMTLSILWFLSVIVASCWGFVEYLRFKHLFGGSVEK
ncbi:MAG TPA: lysylphosphatidylglycerol synthase transmembrane domain-containing protein [Dissulfurispiraceae bacterium]|nr:lysylphosphatidylglycerol synthase transmembrane domain-containing protein [Dissulfurispiraceae bacterium]